MARPDSSRLGVALTVAAAAVIGVVFWHSPALYPLKLLTVVLHEAGHAAATYAVGGSVDAIQINQYQGGLTYCRFEPVWWKRVVVSSSGYLGSAVFGALLLRGAGRPSASRGPRLVLTGLGVGLLLLALLFFRDLFSWGFALASGFTLIASGRFLPDAAARTLAVFVSTFICLYALFDLRDDVLRLPWEQRTDAVTDADALAEVLPLPALFWALLWTGLSGWILWRTLLRVVDPGSLDTPGTGR